MINQDTPDPYSWAEPITRDPRQGGQEAYSQSKGSMMAAKAMGVYEPEWEQPSAGDAGFSGIKDEPETLTWSDAFDGSLWENLAEMTPIVAGLKELRTCARLHGGGWSRENLGIHSRQHLKGPPGFCW